MNASDIMTRGVVTVREGTPLREVAKLLAEHRISGVPVCDGRGRLAGVVTEFDLLAKPDAATAGKAMTRDVISVMEDTPLEEVRFLLVDRKIKRVPVLRDQKVVGILSRADLVREIALTWVCQVCGDHERGEDRPPVCPRCGSPTAYQSASAPPVSGD